MAAFISADMTEVLRLQHTLENADRLAVEKARLVVHKVALDAQTIMKQRAPVDTGFLRNSIGVTFYGGTSAVVGPSADYAVHVEFGTYKMAPQPFVRPAGEAVMPVFTQAMELIVKGMLK